MTPEDMQFTEIPKDWDCLDDPPASDTADTTEDSSAIESQEPPLLLMVAAAWGDLVCLLGMSAGLLLALVVCGYQVSVAGFPWMLAVAALWWGASCAVLVLVKRCTPGMLLAGIAFAHQVAPQRLLKVVGTAALLALLAGIPAILGPRASLLRLASGQSIALA
ncbi:MAG: hypothetical protein GY906_25755 [bacterium]|nr:hypothetical protein [bacterium]